MEAEYTSSIEYTKQAIWIKRLVNEILNKNIKINNIKGNKHCKTL